MKIVGIIAIHLIYGKANFFWQHLHRYPAYTHRLACYFLKTQQNHSMFSLMLKVTMRVILPQHWCSEFQGHKFCFVLLVLDFGTQSLLDFQRYGRFHSHMLLISSVILKSVFPGFQYGLIASHFPRTLQCLPHQIGNVEVFSLLD